MRIPVTSQKMEYKVSQATDPVCSAVMYTFAAFKKALLAADIFVCLDDRHEFYWELPSEGSLESQCASGRAVGNHKWLTCP